MAKHTIIHFKKECISCGACAAIAPDYWEMDEEGLAHLKKSKKNGDHWELDIDTEVARVENQEAVEVCPMGIIHLKKKD